MLRNEQGLPKEDFDREFERALDMIYSIGLKLYRGNEDDAADFTQSLYPFALKQSHKFSGLSAFSTWLYRVAWNFGLEDLRKKKRLATETLDGHEIAFSDPEADFDEQEIQTLRRYISELPDAYRIPLILLYYEKMPYAEIAAITGIKEGTLKANVHRGKQILKNKMGK